MKKNELKSFLKRIKTEMSYHSFSERQTRNIMHLLEAIGSHVTGLGEAFSTGGGFDFVSIQLKDKTWLLLSSGYSDVNHSPNTFETAKELYDAFWGDESSAISEYIQSKGEFENHKKIAEKIIEGKYKPLYQNK